MRFSMCYKKSCNKNNDSNDHPEERFMAQETLGCQVYLGFNFFFYLHTFRRNKNRYKLLAFAEYIVYSQK